MIKDVFSTKVKYMQIMDFDGNIDHSLFPEELTNDKLIEIYKFMNLGRAVSDKLLTLQRLGKVGTIAPLNGEEAAQIGSAYALGKSDFIVPIYRSHIPVIMRSPLLNLFMVAKGYEDGYKSILDSKLLPEIIVVGSQYPHATGIAFGLKYQKYDNVVLVYGGDGSTSQGDFYESINFAGTFNLPIIFLVENNEWAISVPRDRQSAAETLAQKAVAAGIDSIQVDGNDAIAVYKATKDAIESIKKGGKPVVIEALTYRMGMHTTSDDPTKYRPESDVDAWKPKDPIVRLRKYLMSNKLWDDDLENKMLEEQKGLINKAVSDLDNFKPDPKSMFDNVYSFLPEVLKEEEDEAVKNDFWM